MTVAENLKRLRVAAGLTQQELAGEAGVSVSGLSLIEKGLAPNPRMDTILALAGALGCDVGELTGPAAAPGPGLAKPPRGPKRAGVPPTAKLRAKLRTRAGA
jgi:transcriptional regulator with XRE-family HTH domain